MGAGFPPLTRLVAELRRRRVLRVAGVYAALGWLIVEVSSTTFPLLALPAWAPTLLLVLVIAGFPVAVGLAWVFQVVPERAVAIEPAGSTPLPVQPATAAGRDAGTRGGGEAVASGARGASAGGAQVELETAQAQREMSARSIVVLPFENLSPDRDNEYFSEGLTEEVITDLSSLQGLRVISRTSAMLLKGSGKDARTIGRELGVRYLLEGSVRKAGERLRITAQLIDAATDTHLWADRYDGELGDVFAMQEGIARAVAVALRMKLSPDEDRSLAHVPIRQPQAYDSFLRARHEVWLGTAEALERAERYLQSAEEIAGESAILDAAIAYVHFQKANFGYGQDEAVEAAGRFARRALELDPGCAQAYTVLGACAQAFHGNATDSIRLLERARELAPGDLEPIPWLANAMLATGRPEHAIQLARLLVDADPVESNGHLMLAYALTRAGRAHEALEPARSAYRLAPGSPQTYGTLSMVLATLGRTDDMLELRRASALPDSMPLRFGRLYQAAAAHDGEQVDQLVNEELERTASRDPDIALWMADVYAAVGRTEDALDWLQRATSRGQLDYPYIAEHSPFLASVRGTERFRNLAEALHEQWRMYAA